MHYLTEPLLAASLSCDEVWSRLLLCSTSSQNNLIRQSAQSFLWCTVGNYGGSYGHLSTPHIKDSCQELFFLSLESSSSPITCFQFSQYCPKPQSEASMYQFEKMSNWFPTVSGVLHYLLSESPTSMISVWSAVLQTICQTSLCFK